MADKQKKKVPAQFRQLQETLARQLASVGFIWPGTIQRRTRRCGKPNCACHNDPKACHGPYISWTTKKAGKTVTKTLSSAEADLVEEWINNRKVISEILDKMTILSKKALEAMSIDHWSKDTEI